jgi:hypothetical protein
MENAVKDLLIDIVGEMHPPQVLGLNRYFIRWRYDITDSDSFRYFGDKHVFLCEQAGRRLYIQYPTDYNVPVPIFKIDLADPTSRDKIVNIFRTS